MVPHVNQTASDNVGIRINPTKYFASMKAAKNLRVQINDHVQATLRDNNT